MQTTSNQKEPWEIDRTLENISGGPYIFHLKDGTALSLEEWTIGAEKWAKQHFTSMEKLFNILMGQQGDSSDTIDAAIKVAIYKLTDESRRTVDEMRGDKNTVQFFEDMITYKQLAELCRAQFNMIRDSIPIEALEEVKKNHSKLLAEMQGNRAMQRKVAKKTGKKKSARK